ncbi:hypothetical protein IWX47DRAFT_3898 [Phyllosticta citricarpa]
MDSSREFAPQQGRGGKTSFSFKVCQVDATFPKWTADDDNGSSGWCGTKFGRNLVFCRFLWPLDRGYSLAANASETFKSFIPSPFRPPWHNGFDNKEVHLSSHSSVPRMTNWPTPCRGVFGFSQGASLQSSPARSSLSASPSLGKQPRVSSARSRPTVPPARANCSARCPAWPFDRQQLSGRQVSRCRAHETAPFPLPEVSAGHGDPLRARVELHGASAVLASACVATGTSEGKSDLAPHVFVWMMLAFFHR